MQTITRDFHNEHESFRLVPLTGDLLVFGVSQESWCSPVLRALRSTVSDGHWILRITDGRWSVGLSRTRQLRPVKSYLSLFRDRQTDRATSGTDSTTNLRLGPKRSFSQQLGGIGNVWHFIFRCDHQIHGGPPRPPIPLPKSLQRIITPARIENAVLKCLKF